ncbi:MAG: PAS domain S-box protein, partial [Blastocatellia bacterium]
YSGSVSWMDLLHPDDRDRILKQTAAAEVETHYEYRMIAWDGSVRWFHDHGKFVMRDEPPCRCWQGMMTDITERKVAEDALRDSRGFYESLVESLPQSVFRKDIEGRFTFANQRMCSLLGMPLADIAGRTDFDFYPDSLAAKYRADDIRVMQTGETIDMIEEHQTPDGRNRHVQVIKTPVRDRADRVIGVQGIFLDVTERKELEHQFLQSQKMEAIGTLAGGVAHDFNNMLTVISGYSDLLLIGLEENCSHRPHAEEIKRAAERASALTRQLLAFSRKQVLQPTELNLNTVVLDMEKMLRRLIGEDVNLITALTPDPGLVTADAGQIEQVVMNLVVNAREAMPGGGTLTIETGLLRVDEVFLPEHPGLPPGAYMMLAVSDTGSGMDKETRSRIFEPFFTTKKPGSGTGLGLSTVYGIVKQSNGHIDVYSEPGTGTTFKLLFPVSSSEGEGSLTQRFASEVQCGCETVLVVEDEAIVRNLVKRVLEGCGYRVLEAVNGTEALALCAQHAGSIDAVLTDVVMPQMSASELARRIYDRYPDMKMIYMSGYTDGAIASHGILDPDVAFIHKPFTPASLTNKLRETLDRTRAVAS